MRVYLCRTTSKAVKTRVVSVKEARTKVARVSSRLSMMTAKDSTAQEEARVNSQARPVSQARQAMIGTRPASLTTSKVGSNATV
jgi:hypothetical protein